MNGPRRRAFTLPELLIVIAVIGVLAALVFLSLNQAFWTSETTRCIANLHYLSQALAMRRSDSLQSRRPEMRVNEWPIQLLPYVDFNQSVLICPATGGSQRVVDRQPFEEEWDLTVLDDWGTEPDVIEDEPVRGQPLVELAEVQFGNRYTRLEPGPMCLKLSDEQYQAARAEGWFHEQVNGVQNSKYGYGAYKPGSNPRVYWLCFEDYGGPDFDEVQMRVTENDDGTYSLWIRSGYTAGTGGTLVTPAPEHKPIMYLGKRQEGIQITLGQPPEPKEPEQTGGYEAGTNPYGRREEEGESGVVATSYALNVEPALVRKSPTYVPLESGKIVLLDYCKWLARATDAWSDRAVDPDGDGVPIFARHGGRLNVLFSDGAVQTLYPAEIDPISPENEILYWRP